MIKIIRKCRWILLGIYFFFVILWNFLVWITNEMKITDKISCSWTSIFFILYPLIYLVVNKLSKEFKQQKRDIDNYYAMQLPVYDRRRIARISLVKVLFRAVIIVLTLIAGGIIWIYSDTVAKILKDIHNDLIEVCKMDTLLAIVIAIYAFIATLFPILMSYMNNNSLFFDAYELPIIKKFNLSFFISILVVLIYLVLYCFVQLPIDYYEIYGALEAIWGALIIYNIFVYIVLFLLPVKVDRKITEKIDKVYYTRKNYLTPSKKWYKGRTIKEFSYLFEEYRKSLKKIKFDDIESIKLSSVLKENDNNVRYAKNNCRKWLSLGLAYLAFIVLAIFNQSNMPWTEVLKNMYFAITIAGVLPLIIVLICSLWESKLIRNNYGFINASIFNQHWGYDIKFKQKRKCIYVSSFDYYPTKYYKFVRNLKKIVCFYNLSSNMQYEDEEHFSLYCLECLCSCVKDMRKRNEDISGMIAPIIMCTCIGKNINDADYGTIDINQEKQIFAECTIEREIKNIISIVCVEMLRELHGDDETFDKAKVKKVVAQFWE